MEDLIETEFNTLTAVASLSLEFLHVLVISKTGAHSIWPPRNSGTDRCYTAEAAFKNCPSLRYVYIEDIDMTGHDPLPVYKRYQRKNDENSNNEHSVDCDEVGEADAHAWWMPYWSRY